MKALILLVMYVDDPRTGHRQLHETTVLPAKEAIQRVGEYIVAAEDPEILNSEDASNWKPYGGTIDVKPFLYPSEQLKRLILENPGESIASLLDIEFSPELQALSDAFGDYDGEEGPYEALVEALKK